MNFRKSALTILAVAFTLGLVSGQIPMQTLIRLTDTLTHIQAVKKYKGLSVAVHIKGQGDWTRAVGVSTPNTPLDPQMVMGIGSNTKTFLSAAILQMFEKGMLDLDDSVGKWLPPLPNIKGSIAIRQLLNHTSGIYNYTTNSDLNDSVALNPFRVWTKEELVKKFTKSPLFNPGQSWSYSNTNYLVAGMIAEAVSGIPTYTYIRDSILTPLQLNNTFLPPYETVTAPSAQIWSSGPGTPLQQVYVPVQFYSIADAAGGMISTAEDNCIFWRNLFEGNIIKKQTLRTEMMQWVNSPMGGYGLGLVRDHLFNTQFYSHGGSILGQLCANLCDTTRGIYISVLSNQDSIIPEPVVYGLYKVILSEYNIIASSVSEHSQLQPLTFYPNPAHSTIFVNRKPGSILRIFAVDGQLKKEIREPGRNIPIEDFENGVYILQLHEGDAIRTGRLVKQAGS